MHPSTHTLAALALLFAACADDPSDMTTASASATDSGSTVADTSDASDSHPSTTSGSDSDSEGPSSSPTSEPTTGSEASGSETSGSAERGDSSSSDDTGIGDCHPLLVEVLYDALDGDDELQWVKLYNPCSAQIELGGYSLGYGGTDYVPDIDPPFGVKTLQGGLAAGGCYIVGGPMQAASNGDPDIDLDEDFAPSLELGERVGAGVALFDVAADAVDTATVPIDAVIYGPNNDNGLIDTSGAPAPAPNVGNSVAGGSIQRTGLAADWVTAELPTPGLCPPF